MKSHFVPLRLQNLILWADASEVLCFNWSVLLAGGFGVTIFFMQTLLHVTSHAEPFSFLFSLFTSFL